CGGGGAGLLQERSSAKGRIPEARLGKIELRVTILLAPPRDSGVWRAGFGFKLVSIGDRKCRNPDLLSRKSPRKPQFFILTLTYAAVFRRGTRFSPLFSAHRDPGGRRFPGEFRITRVLPCRSHGIGG